MPLEDKLNFSPLKKYKKYSRFPWKLTLHLILIIFTSYQAFVIAKDRNLHTRTIRDTYYYIFLGTTDERNNIQFLNVPDFQQYFLQIQNLLSNFTQVVLFQMDNSQAQYLLNTDLIIIPNNKLYQNLSVSININNPIIYPFNLSNLVETRNYIKQARSLSLIASNFYTYWSNYGDEMERTCLNWTLQFVFSFSQKGSINGNLYTSNKLCSNQDLYHSGLNFLMINVIVLTFSTISFVLYVIYLHRVGSEYLKQKILINNLNNVVRRISTNEQEQISFFQDSNVLCQTQQKNLQKNTIYQKNINQTESMISNSSNSQEDIQLDSLKLKKLKTIEEHDSERYSNNSQIKQQQKQQNDNNIYQEQNKQSQELQSEENENLSSKDLLKDQQQQIQLNNNQNQFFNIADRKVSLRVQRCISNSNQLESPASLKKMIQVVERESFDMNYVDQDIDDENQNVEQYLVQEENQQINQIQEQVNFVNLWFVFGALSNFFQMLGSLIAIIDTFSDSELDAFIQKETLVGIGAMLSWITVLQYLSYDNSLSIMNKTLYVSIINIVWFFIGVFPWFFGFVFFAQNIFYYYAEFSSIEVSLVTLFSMTWGDNINYTFLEVQAEGLAGWIFLIIFLLIFYTAIQNIFVNIILNGYEIIREENLKIQKQKQLNSKLKKQQYAPQMQVQELQSIIQSQLHNKFDNNNNLQNQNNNEEDNDDQSLVLCKLQLNIQRINYLISEMSRVIKNDLKVSQLQRQEKEFVVKDYLSHLENIYRHVKIHIADAKK